MTDGELKARIARATGGKAGYKQLVRELGLGGGRERRLLLEQLARMSARGELVKIDREHWALPGRAGTRENLAAGRLELHRDGYGFVRPRMRRGGETLEDIFVPPNALGGAMQGDEVLVELEPPRADGRRAGRVARVLERRNPTVVGIFHCGASAESPSGGREPRLARFRENVVLPFDERMTQPIVISGDWPRGEDLSPHRVLGAEALAHPRYASLEETSPEGMSLEGLVVDVEITRWPTETRAAEGRVVEVLGSPDDFGVDVEMTIRKHQLPRIFPENVLAEARAVARLDQEEIGRRRDFRGLPVVTIDGETARDFDDAVLVREREGGGYELLVHIADVAEYVREGTDLDLEARLRGTSVYFPDRAVPMLPQELSTEICSLRPGEDRLTLSCLMQLDSEGRIESYEIVEGVIRSAARMTYAEVHAILEGDAEARTRNAGLVPEFERMKKLAVEMNLRREERGSIDFDLPEPVIEFDEQGQMRGITKAERTWANRIIEEFMLAANECVAAWLEDLGVPSLYRIHEKPEARRVVEFEELAASFGYSLGLGPLPVRTIQLRAERRESHGRGRNPRRHEVAEEIAVTPKMYQKLAGRIEGKPEERILSYLMLRSLMQARYSETNVGHFALAAPVYTHFTSPIRRYPDLVVHRIAKALLRAGVSGRGEAAKGRLDSPWRHTSEAPGGIVGARTRSSLTPLTPPTPLTPLNYPMPESELAQIAEESSLAERRAADAERELVEWKKVRFMQERVGEEFAALVLNPAKYGLFVELTEMFVEGLVPIDTLRGDRYTWRENTHEIVGERTGRRFRPGDRVQVILDRVLAQERKLQFALVEDGVETGERRAAKPAPKAKKTKRQQAAAAAKKLKKAGRRGRRR